MHVDRRLLPWLAEARRPLAVAVTLGVGAGALVVLLAALLARVVDGAFLRGEGSTPWAPGCWHSPRRPSHAQPAWWSDVSGQAAASSVKQSLREALTRRILARGPAWTAGERTGELTRSLVDGVETLDAYVAQYLPQLLLAAVVPSLVLATVTVRDPLSGVVLLGAVGSCELPKPKLPSIGLAPGAAGVAVVAPHLAAVAAGIRATTK